MSLISKGLREFIETSEYQYTSVNNDCFRMRFTGKHGDYNLFAQVGEDPSQVMVFTYCPVKVPEERRSTTADYINRVNYGLRIGSLEMDPEDGEVRARSAGPVRPGEQPTPEVIGPLFDASFYLIDNWLPGLLRVAFGADDPATAYAKTLASLRSAPNEQALSAGEVVSDLDEGGPELTAIEVEVSRLLADHDLESPPTSM